MKVLSNSDLALKSKAQAKAMKKYSLKKREAYDEFKASLSCISCGQDHISTLHFHHLDPIEKEFSIGGGVPSKGLKSLIEESKKCIVLCANCHAIEHYNQRLLSKPIDIEI